MAKEIVGAIDATSQGTKGTNLFALLPVPRMINRRCYRANAIGQLNESNWK